MLLSRPKRPCEAPSQRKLPRAKPPPTGRAVMLPLWSPSCGSLPLRGLYVYMLPRGNAGSRRAFGWRCASFFVHALMPR